MPAPVIDDKLWALIEPLFTSHKPEQAISWAPAGSDLAALNGTKGGP
ncbi:transposase [Paraburkholderia sp. WSM4175]